MGNSSMRAAPVRARLRDRILSRGSTGPRPRKRSAILKMPSPSGQGVRELQDPQHRQFTLPEIRTSK